MHLFYFVNIIVRCRHNINYRTQQIGGEYRNVGKFVKNIYLEQDIVDVG